ncbi:MAG: 50S ribosomal protein L29 [Bacteroidales bacterium]|jgi:large subunit ribosomal protein L29|nr:50S ribosomal protein L29 [Bacteroidales bacterium]
MKTSEIKELSDKEIRERIQELSDTLVRLRMNHAVSPLENPVKIPNTRRDIARLKTILHERELIKEQK